MRVRVLSRPVSAIGFELVGLPVTRVDDMAAAARAVKQLTAEPEVGVILVDEDVYRALPHVLLARLDRQAPPIVVPVPAPRWEERGEAEASILDMLRQAIGYRVRLR